MTVSEIQDLYDSERAALRSISQAMRLRHSFKGVKTIDQEDAIKRTFTHEAINRCAEVGLVVDVLWEWKDDKTGESSPTVSDNPEDHSLYWNPRIVVTGRTEAVGDYDHDKQKHEVQSGLLDGKAGVIREDGTFREDPTKKSFFTG